MTRGSVRGGLCGLLFDNCSRHPDSAAVVGVRADYTWLELAAAAGLLRLQLGELRLPVATVVGICLTSSPDWLAAFFAVRACRHTSVSIGKAENPERLRAMIRTWGVRAMICESGDDLTRGLAQEMHLPAIAPHEAAVTHADHLIGRSSGQRLDDVVTLHLTSGSTGHPRAVPRSEGNLLDEAQAVAAALTPAIAGGVLCSTPVYHSFASGLVLAALHRPAPSVLVERFSPHEVLQLLDHHLPAILAGVPYVFDVLSRVRFSRRYRTDSLVLGISGGAPLTRDCRTRFEKRFAIPLVQEYGLSEGGIATIGRPEERSHDDLVGRPIAGVVVRIADPRDPALSLPLGAVGEVLIQRRFCPTSYVGKHADAADRFLPHVNSIRTGDLGLLDKSGSLQLMGRIKDIVNVAGMKVAPRAVEQVLAAHPSVREALAFGMPHPLLGESVAAVVVPYRSSKLTVADLLSRCRRELPTHAVPRQLAIVQELPRTLTGKTDMIKLKRELNRIFAKDAPE